MSKFMSLNVKCFIVNFLILGGIYPSILLSQEIEIRKPRDCGGKRVSLPDQDRNSKKTETGKGIGDAKEQRKAKEKFPEKIVIERPRIIARLQYMKGWKENPLAIRHLLLFMEESVKVSALEIKSHKNVTLTKDQKLSIFDQLSDFEINLDEKHGAKIASPILSGDIPGPMGGEEAIGTFEVLSEDQETEAETFLILYITGHDDFDLDDKKINKLRSYLLRGGMLFGDSSSGEQGFAKGFKRLCYKLFPKRTIEHLPDNHPLFRAFYNLENIRYTGKVKPEKGKRLEGIKLGCRTAVVFSPDSVSCGWDGHMHGEYVDHEMHYDDALKLGVNLIAYALGYRELGSDLNKIALLKSKTDYNETDFAFTQIRYNGDWDPDPFGVANFLNYFSEKVSVEMHPSRIIVDPDKDEFSSLPFLYIMGHGNLSFTKPAKDNFRRFFKNGGILWAESCCGDKDFETSFKKISKEIFPDDHFEPLNESHSLFNNYYNLQSLDLRPKGLMKLKALLNASYTEAKAATLFQKRSPYIESLNVGGRIKIIFSPIDLSCAWEKQPCLVCQGVSHKNPDSFKLGVNLLTYILTRYE